MTDVIQAPGMGHNQPDPLEMEKKNQKWDQQIKNPQMHRADEHKSHDDDDSNQKAYGVSREYSDQPEPARL